MINTNGVCQKRMSNDKKKDKEGETGQGRYGTGTRSLSHLSHLSLCRPQSQLPVLPVALPPSQRSLSSLLSRPSLWILWNLLHLVLSFLVMPGIRMPWTERFGTVLGRPAAKFLAKKFCGPTGQPTRTSESTGTATHPNAVWISRR